MKNAIICDIDGTLALHHGLRSPYKTEEAYKDKPNTAIIDILNRYKDDTRIILVSGRKEEFKDLTEKWLKKHNVPYHDLYMRNVSTEIKDFIVKSQIYDEYIKGKYDVIFVLDDRDRLVDMWRERGLICLQVAEGDF